MAIGTPFHSRTSALCESMSWREWSGYFAVNSYDTQHEHEYHSIRNTAGLIDVSPLFKYQITGKDALKLVNRIITRDVSKCSIGQVMYTCWCDSAGKIVDDGTVFREDKNRFRVNSTDANLRWFRLNAHGMDVKIEDVSETIAAIALQGPTSRDILKQVSDVDMDKLKFFRFTSANLDGIGVNISRTGYTGDLGYEIWVSHKDASRLWDILIASGKNYGITPVGLLALDIARIEAGFILGGVDYISVNKAIINSQKYSPFQIGLGWAVNFKKTNFVGRASLLEEKKVGAPRKFVGLETEQDELERLYETVGLPPQLPTTAWRTGIPIYANGKQIGKATSGTWSPTLKKDIALATIESKYAELDSMVMKEVTINYERRKVPARIVKTPFFDPERKKA